MLVNPLPAVSGLTTEDRAEIADTVTAALLEGPGLPLKLAPTSVTGSGGADIYRNLTLPVGLTLVTGRKYRIEGILLIRNGSTRLAEIAYEHHILKRGSGSWSEVRPGSSDPILESGAETYFATEAELFILGENSGALALVGKPINGQTVTIEFDGLISDLGTD